MNGLDLQNDAFDKAVVHASHSFRALMNAMAGPGKSVSVIDGFPTIAGLNSGSSLVAHSLCDYEVSVWLASDDNIEKTREEFTFQCGCRFVDQACEADFAFFKQMPSLDKLDELKIGNAQYPDRSCTAVIEMPSFAEGRTLVFEGPGIERQNAIQVDGLSDDFIQWWPRNRQKFPLGIDLILTSQTHILALPRTVNIKVAAECT